jgi:hypothetical protein
MENSPWMGRNLHSLISRFKSDWYGKDYENSNMSTAESFGALLCEDKLKHLLTCLKVCIKIDKRVKMIMNSKCGV